MFNYCAYGVGITSEIELPELNRAANCDSPITIRQQQLSPHYDDSQAESFRFQIAEDGIYLNWRLIGTFFVADTGLSILCDLEPNIDPDWIRLAILGPVIPIALHNQGYLVLHAGACEVGGHAVLFVGPGGAGKSTMLAAMNRRGHLPLCDDTVAIAIDPGSDGHFWIYPGIPRLKLWPDTASLGELALPKSPPIYEGHAKVSVDVRRNFGDVASSYRIRCVFSLCVGPSIELTLVPKTEALLGLVSNCYAGMMNKSLAAKRRSSEFIQCSALAKATDMLRLQRPEDLEQIGLLAKMVEEFVIDPQSAATVPGIQMVENA